MENTVLGANEKYCVRCGKVILREAVICPNCGVAQPLIHNNAYNNMQQGGERDWTTALLLCMFTGVFGGHRFYTGHIGIAIAQLFTMGGCGIWSFCDLISIVTNTFRDVEGLPLDRK